MQTGQPRGRNPSRSDGIIIITKVRNPTLHVTPLLVSKQCTRRQLVTGLIIQQHRHRLRKQPLSPKKVPHKRRCRLCTHFKIKRSSVHNHPISHTTWHTWTDEAQFEMTCNVNRLVMICNKINLETNRFESRTKIQTKVRWNAWQAYCTECLLRRVVSPITTYNQSTQQNERNSRKTYTNTQLHHKAHLLCLKVHSTSAGISNAAWSGAEPMERSIQLFANYHALLVFQHKKPHWSSED